METWTANNNSHAFVCVLVPPLPPIRFRDAPSVLVGGIRGSGELRRLVTNPAPEEGAWAVAFCMFPVSVDQVMRVADADQLMPPKVRRKRKKAAPLDDGIEGVLFHRRF